MIPCNTHTIIVPNEDHPIMYLSVEVDDTQMCRAIERVLSKNQQVVVVGNTEPLHKDIIPMPISILYEKQENYQWCKLKDSLNHLPYQDRKKFWNRR
jgi:hypothetical protein